MFLLLSNCVGTLKFKVSSKRVFIEQLRVFELMESDTTEVFPKAFVVEQSDTLVMEKGIGINFNEDTRLLIKTKTGVFSEKLLRNIVHNQHVKINLYIKPRTNYYGGTCVTCINGKHIDKTTISRSHGPVECDLLEIITIPMRKVKK
jgi:hypothetical protein